MKDYLNSQIITYMGNKRKLLNEIEKVLINLEKKEGKKLTIGDGFSGSGIVSRLFKQYADKLYVNDTVQTDSFTSLNRAFGLQPVMKNDKNQDISKNIAEYKKQSEELKNISIDI